MDAFEHSIIYGNIIIFVFILKSMHISMNRLHYENIHYESLHVNASTLLLM